jgi:hypothetical protein
MRSTTWSLLPLTTNWFVFARFLMNKYYRQVNSMIAGLKTWFLFSGVLLTIKVRIYNVCPEYIISLKY